MNRHSLSTVRPPALFFVLLGVLTLAAYGSTAAAARPTARHSVASSTRRLLGHERDAARYARARGMSAGIAVLDTRTGQLTSAGDPSRLYPSASVVKVLIATRFLATHHHPTRGQKQLLHLMIASSDNDAATTLYRQVGRDRLLPWVSRYYHLPHLGAVPFLPGYWGSTRLTAIGLVHLFAAVKQDRFVWPLLSQAMHDHTARSSAGEPNDFGLAAVAAHVAIKNGWAVHQRAHHAVRAGINTSGLVHRDRYAVAILTDSPSSFYYVEGERIVTHLAKQVAQGGGLVARPAAAVLTSAVTSMGLPEYREPAGTIRPLVVLDPGHNGGNASHRSQIDRRVPMGYGRTKPCNTTGTSTDSGYPEHAFTFDVALRTRAVLINHGLRVHMTRRNDRGVGPCVNVRARIESQRDAVASVAIHADGAPSSGHGFHVSEDSRRPVGASAATVRRSYALGRAVHDELADRSGLVPSTYIGHRGYYNRTDLAGLNLSTKPTTFLEIGNMRNAHDARIQRSSKGRERIARAVAYGILRYLSR